MPVGFTQLDSRNTLFNLWTGEAATPPPDPTEEIMRIIAQRNRTGKFDSKDNMLDWKIVLVDFCTDTFSVMHLEVFFGLLTDVAPVYSFGTPSY